MGTRPPPPWPAQTTPVVARTPPVRTALTHTCCQGQTSGLTVRPDAAR